MTLGNGGRTLPSVITPTGSSQAVVANPTAGAVGQGHSGVTSNVDDTSSASATVLSDLVALLPAVPLSQELLCSPLLGAGCGGVLLPWSPRDVAAVPAHSRGDDACRCCVTLTLAPGPAAGTPGEKRGARCAGPGSRAALISCSTHSLSQHWWLSTPGRRGAPCPGNGWGNSRAWETIKIQHS